MNAKKPPGRIVRKKSDGEYRPEVHSLATNPKGGTLKRTRRVEVIRYSRRSTVIGNEVPCERDLNEEQAAIDVLLAIPCTIEPPIEVTSEFQKPDREEGSTAAIDPGAVQKRQALRFLKKLVRG
jgi:hypothetical protein